MWNEPTEEELRKLPGLYSTEGVAPEKKVIQMHFFIGGCDWYAAEYDPQKRVFFGLAILNDDLDNGEWGHFGLDRLRTLKAGPFDVDRDLHWAPCQAKHVERIATACGWGQG